MARRYYPFRQNDSSGSIVLVIPSGLASDIATAAATFSVMDEDGNAVFTDGLATISAVTAASDGSKGATFTHDVTSETTADAGTYWGTFRVTYTSGYAQTVPGSESLTFRVAPEYASLSASSSGAAAQGVLQSQAAHGLAVKDLVYNNAGTWAEARANADSTLAEAVVVSVDSVNLFRVVYLSAGEVTLAAHGLGAAGTMLYLSQGTAGAITSTAPTSGIKQKVGKVKDANTLIVWPHVVEVL